MTAPQPTGTARIAVAWLAVGIPLVYGVYNIVVKTAPLFGG